MSATIRKFLDLNSAHLREDTRDWLDGHYWEGPDGLCGGAVRYGWFIHAESSIPDPRVSADLRRCLRKAIECGADYVLFDADGPLCDGLTIYED